MGTFSVRDTHSQNPLAHLRNTPAEAAVFGSFCSFAGCQKPAFAFTPRHLMQMHKVGTLYHTGALLAFN